MASAGTGYAKRAVGWLRKCLERAGVRGLKWSSVPVPEEEYPELHHPAAGAFRVSGFTDYRRPDLIRTLLTRIIEKAVWIDTTRISIHPIGHLEVYAFSIDIIFFDPKRTLQSAEARQILSRRMPLTAQISSVHEALCRELDDHLRKLPKEAAKRFQFETSRYLTPGTWEGKEEEVGRFEGSLPEEIRPTLLDLHLVVELPRRHRELLRDIDDWVERDRHLPQGGIRGQEIRPAPWTTFEYHTEKTEIPELVRNATAPHLDAGALFRVVSNPEASKQQRNDAFFKLLDLPQEEAEPFLVRSAGFEEVRINALQALLGVSSTTPLFREIIFENRPEVVLQKLDHLRESPGKEGWKSPLPDTVPEGLGELYQEIILRNYAMTADLTVVPDLVTEIRRGTRSADWISGAIHTLSAFGAEEAADPILKYVAHSNPSVSTEALQFFASVDHPPAHDILLKALQHSDLRVVTCAEDGLSGQESGGWNLLLDGLEILHSRAIAIPSQSEDNRFRNVLGIDILQTLPRISGRCPRPALVRKCVQRVGEENVPGIEPVMETGNGKKWTRKNILREDAVGDHSPVQTYEKRMRLWQQKGYALARYRADGDRDPAWDAQVERGHRGYDPERDIQDPRVTRAYRSAIRLGCKDGIVHYRLGVCCHAESRPEEAYAHFRRALSRIPDHYPLNPYLLAAAESLALRVREQGRLIRALDLYRIAVTDDMSAPGASREITALEEEIEYRDLRREQVELLEPGDLPPAPSRHHPAAITSLEVAPAQTHFLSTDCAGNVQVSAMIQDARPDLVPDMRAALHASGKTFATWILPQDGTLVSAGEDAQILQVHFSPGRELSIRRRFEHAHPVEGLVRAGNRMVAFVDRPGDIFLLDLERGIMQPLPRRETIPVRKLASCGGWLVATNRDVGVECWTVHPRPELVWVTEIDRTDEITFAEAIPPDHLLLGTVEGSLLELNLLTGEEVEMKPMPAQGGHPGMARFHPEHAVSIWGFSTGSILIHMGEKGPRVVLHTEPVVRMDVDFQNGMIVHGDTHNTLHVHNFPGFPEGGEEPGSETE